MNENCGIYYKNKKGQSVSPMWSTFYKDYVQPKGLKLHHEALCRGYQRVNSYSMEQYEGRFGKGIKVYKNNPLSTQYRIVQYWTVEE